MSFFLSILLMTFFGSLGALFFKRGAVGITGLRTLLFSPQLWLGGGCYLAGAALNIWLLHGHDYSVVYPLTSLTYVWSLALSAAFLRERITMRKLLGVAAVCLGAFLLTR